MDKLFSCGERASLRVYPYYKSLWMNFSYNLRLCSSTNASEIRGKRMSRLLLSSSALPCVVLALAGVLLPSLEQPFQNLLAYHGLASLSYSGAVFTGASMGRLVDTRTLIAASLLPPALGLTSMLFPFVPWTLSVQALSFIAVHAMERKMFARNLIAEWYVRVKLILTVVGVSSVLLSVAVSSYRYTFFPTEKELVNTVLSKLKIQSGPGRFKKKGD